MGTDGAEGGLSQLPGPLTGSRTAAGGVGERGVGRTEKAGEYRGFGQHRRRGRGEFTAAVELSGQLSGVVRIEMKFVARSHIRSDYRDRGVVPRARLFQPICTLVVQSIFA